MLAWLRNPLESRSQTRVQSVALLVALAGAALGAPPLLAEPDPPDRQQSIEMLAAHAVTRAALVDLKLVGTPTQRDYRIAEELLATASNLLPNDQTILRLYMEAAAGADDTATIRDIARRLVKLDAQDTVSQLRVISANISDLQTADQRLSVYDRFVSGEGADEFDASVRSRLALDAALLYRERGDMALFADRLSTAIELDPTNKDAATLALAFYAPQPSDPTGRLDLLFMVLRADPFDPSVYNSIVSELLAQGAYKGAHRFAKLQRRLYAIQSRPMPEGDEFAYDLTEWCAMGPEPVIRRLSDGLEKRRQNAFEQRKQAQEHALATNTLLRPDELHLSVSRERSRILCAASLGDRERAAIFLSEFAIIADRMARDASDPLRRPAGIGEPQARDEAQGAAIDLLWLRLLCAQQVEEAGKSLADLRAAGTLDAQTLARLDAWLMLRAGDRAKAEQSLGALAPVDPLAALGHCMAAELRDDPNTAIVRYAELIRRDQGDFVGAFAATRYFTITGERLPLTAGALALEADAASVPQWLDGMVDNPRRVMSLEVASLRTDIVPIDRTPVRVTLRNTSQIPMAVGPDKPICSRLLFGPSVDIGADRMPTADLVWVANIDRRLRLLPNEAIDIIVWPDLGPLSSAMELSLPKQARVRWRVLQGFELSPQRLYDAAPLMLTADVPPLVRRLPNRTEAVFEALQHTLQTGGPREIADALLALKLQIFQSNVVVTTLTNANIDQLMEVLARRCTSDNKLGRASKIIALCLVPSALPTNVPQTMRLDQVAAQDPDEDVLAVELAVRVFSPNDPIFTSPNVLKSTRLTALAQLVKDRLEAGVISAANAPIKWDNLIGPNNAKPVAPNTPGPNAAPQSNTPSGTPTETRPPRLISPSIPPDPDPVPSIP